MIVSKQKEKHNIKIDDETIEQVASFKYLGSIFTEDGKFEEKIIASVRAAGRLINNSIKTSFLDKNEIPSNVKIEVLRKVAAPIQLYASESWTTTSNNRSKIRSGEMRFLRKIEGKTKLDIIRNDTFRKTTHKTHRDYN